MKVQHLLSTRHAASELRDVPDSLLAETVPALQLPNCPTLTRLCAQQEPVTPVQLSVLYGCCIR